MGMRALWWEWTPEGPWTTLLHEWAVFSQGHQDTNLLDCFCNSLQAGTCLGRDGSRDTHGNVHGKGFVMNPAALVLSLSAHWLLWAPPHLAVALQRLIPSLHSSHSIPEGPSFLPTKLL